MERKLELLKVSATLCNRRPWVRQLGRPQSTSTMALLAFMGGFAVGRVVSLAADGVPGALVLALLALEVAYSMAAGVLLWHRRGASGNSLQGKRP